MKKLFDYVPPIILVPVLLLSMPIFILGLAFIPMKWNPLSDRFRYEN